LDRSEAKGSRERLDRPGFREMQDPKASKGFRAQQGRPETKASKGFRGSRERQDRLDGRDRQV
jgi:hypothetical protein